MIDALTDHQFVRQSKSFFVYYFLCRRDKLMGSNFSSPGTKLVDLFTRASSASGGRLQKRLCDSTPLSSGSKRGKLEKILSQATSNKNVYSRSDRFNSDALLSLETLEV